MSRSTQVWLVVAALFACVNVLGAWWAATHAEPLHAGVHVALLAATAGAVVLLMRRPSPHA
ncbi:hypothetical protein [Roseisolibacter sp. H3M3-2]|uniref:hypothetical protein n=1 Tax=Roseisolibacter sp. H3M3-2 TaxID=3031323 RepID=UPI0023DC767D|nr:hypothetical protein [Roseisolibacter sp. H3M3-2]MDF1505107.1 hypothetical protein [Roseisolibacter sp. H3M3-2]